jgi:hypothetical protein
VSSRPTSWTMRSSVAKLSFATRLSPAHQFRMQMDQVDEDEVLVVLVEAEGGRPRRSVRRAVADEVQLDQDIVERGERGMSATATFALMMAWSAECVRISSGTRPH